MAGKLILFVCTGNICRSPMAEYLFRARLPADTEWRVASAGIMALDGAPASREAVEVLRDRGIDLRVHQSRCVTREMLNESALVVAMAEVHRAQLWALYRDPRLDERTFLLSAFNPQAEFADLEDPIGEPIAAYARACELIEQALPDLLTYVERLQV